VTVHRHAAQVAADRLERASGLLRALGEDERRVVEHLAFAVAAGVADCLAEEARRNPAVASALQSVSSSSRGSVSQSPVPRSAHAAS
jgi:hypothetical protein